ncbi:MAG: TcaA 3rd/4th domain-containing protein [Clostridium sp.]
MELKDKLLEYTNKIKLYVDEYINDIKNKSFKELISKRKISFIIIALTIMMMGGYFIGNLTMSKSQVYNKLERSLKDSNEGELRSIVRINGKKPKRGELAPLIELYRGNADKVLFLMKELKDDGESSHMLINTEEKILGEDCYITLKRYNIRIDSNYKEGTIYINDKEQVSPGETIRGIIPGLYSIKGVLSSDYGDVIENKDIVVEKDEIIDLSFKANNITIDSQFKDADVYINKKNSNMKVVNFVDIGPFPQDGSVSISIEKEFPWGKINSDEYIISELKDVKINLNIANEKLILDINKVVEEFYQSVFLSLNEEEKSLIKNSSEDATNKIYNILKKNYFILKNKYDFVKLDIKQENSVYTYEDNKYKATIVAEVDYTVSKELFGLGKEEKNKKFFTKLVYEKNKWVIDNVENFSL